MGIAERSISAGILILLTAAVRSAAMNRLPKRTFLALWGIVLIRLLLPFSLPLSAGIGRLSGLGTELAAAVETAGMELSGRMDTDSAAAGGTPQPGENTDKPIVDESRNTAAVRPHILTIVWLAGMLFTAIWFAAAYIRSSRCIADALPVDGSSDKQSLLAVLCRKQNIRCRTVRLLASDRLGTPVTWGILRPKIVLSTLMDSTDEWMTACVIEHELVHIRRFDQLWKLAAAAALCIHWFNPLVWLMYSLFVRDLEISCDERVVFSQGVENRQRYAMTLICLAEQKTGLPVLYSGFGRAAVRERIVAIMKTKKTTMTGILCAAGLVLASATVFAAGSSTETDNFAETLSSYQKALEQDSYYNWVRLENSLLKDDAEAKQLILQYEPYGLSYSEEYDELFFEGKPVRELYDEHTGVFLARTMGRGFLKDSVDVRAVYDGDRLTGLRAATEEEYSLRTAERLEVSESADSEEENSLIGTDERDTLKSIEENEEKEIRQMEEAELSAAIAAQQEVMKALEELEKRNAETD